MKKIFLFITLLSYSTLVFTQEKDSVLIDKPIKVETFKKNAVFLELGGNAFLYSLNYERLNKISENLKLSYGAGLELLVGESQDISPNKRNRDKYPIFAVTPAVNLLFGRNKSHLEIGTSTGLLYIVPVIQTFRLGYRYQGEKVLFRIGFTPIFSFPHDGNFHFLTPWGGVSLGYRF